MLSLPISRVVDKAIEHIGARRYYVPNVETTKNQEFSPLLAG